MQHVPLTLKYSNMNIIQIILYYCAARMYKHESYLSNTRRNMHYFNSLTYLETACWNLRFKM